MKKIALLPVAMSLFLLPSCSGPKTAGAKPFVGYLTQTHELGGQTYTILCDNGTAHRIVMPAPGQPKDDAACTVPISIGTWQQVGETIKFSATQVCYARGQVLSGQASGGIPSCTQSFGALACEAQTANFAIIASDIVQGSTVHERLPDQHRNKSVHRRFTGDMPAECSAEWRPRNAAALMAYVKRELHH